MIFGFSSLGKGVLIFTLFVISMALIDTSIVSLFAIQFIANEENLLKAIFSIMVITIITLVVVFTFLSKDFLTQSRTDGKEGFLFFVLFKYIQIPVLILLFISLIFVLLLDYYIYIFIMSIIFIVHFEATFLFCWLVVKFFKWYMNNSSKFVLLYIISFLIMTSFIVFSLFNYMINFQGLFNKVIYTPYYVLVYIISLSLSDVYYIREIKFIMSFLSFISIWLTTAVLLKEYVKKNNQLYFWGLVTIPLLYYCLQFMFIELHFLSSLIFIDPINNLILYEFLFLFSYPLGGILFGITIFLISIRIISKEVKMYLRLLSLGFMLLFVSFQPNSLLYHPFPPFGISISLMGIGSLLVTISLYYVVYTLSKNIAISRELIQLLGEKNFLIYLSEGKKMSELTKMVQEIYHKIEGSDTYKDHRKSDDLSKAQIDDMFEFITNELQKKP